MKLINADTLLTEISNGKYCKYCEVGKLYGCGDCDLYSFRDDNIEKLIDAQPNVNAVTIKHGRWIEHPWNPAEWKYSCSLCGGGIDTERKFCPDCGAMMDGIVLGELDNGGDL